MMRMRLLTACRVVAGIAAIGAIALFLPARHADAVNSLQAQLGALDREIDRLEEAIEEAKYEEEEEGDADEYVAVLEESLDKARLEREKLAKRIAKTRRRQRLKPATPPIIAERIVESAVLGETPQLTEPRSIIRAFAPPPGAPAAAAVRQLRILNDARQMILPGGGQGPSPPTVDFLNPRDLSYWARVSLQQGLSDAFFEPQYMASSFDGARLIVAARGSDTRVFPTNPVPPHLAVINAVAGQLEKRILLDTTFWPTSLVFSPDGRTVYVAVSVLGPSGLTGQQMVLLVDVETGVVGPRIELPSGGRSGEIVITPDGALLFLLANLDSPYLYAIDTRSQTVIAQIGGLPGQTPSRRALREATEIAIDSAGTRVYVADAAAPQADNDFDTVGIAVVDVASATVTHLVPLPGVRRRGSGDDLRATASTIIHLDGVSGLLTFIDSLSLEVIDQRDIGDALFESAISRTR